MNDEVTEDEITARLANLPDWKREGQCITRTYTMSDFAHALGFVVEVGVLAEAAGHHPDITLRGWNKVDITVSSHDTGALTKRDFDLADKIAAAHTKR
jgi:4a-hydroxytetrahydrobiopterin dehydratase